MGVICDKFGARKGLGFLLLGVVPALIAMMFVQTPWLFILLRCIIGFSLATFVACQTWCSQMFNKKVVGIANATAAGWGNLGGGITNLTMPFVFDLFMGFTGNNRNLSWRLSYIVPTILHIMGGLAVLTARDLPDGNYKELEQAGAKQPSKASTVIKVGFSNINAWIFTLTYGMCFGVELTMNNVAAKYFYTYHGMTVRLAGICASMWGMMNLFARSIGGYLSDWAYGKWGIRGRLWCCWAVQTLEGVFCIILGAITVGYSAPHSSSVGGTTIASFTNLGDVPVRAAVNSLVPNSHVPSGWVNLQTLCNGTDTTVTLTGPACSTKSTEIDDALRACLGLPADTVSILRQTAPPGHGHDEIVGGYNCIRTRTPPARCSSSPFSSASRPPRAQHGIVLHLASRARCRLGHGRRRRQLGRGNLRQPLLPRRLPYRPGHPVHGHLYHRLHRPHLLHVLPGRGQGRRQHALQESRQLRPSAHQAAIRIPRRGLDGLRGGQEEPQRRQLRRAGKDAVDDGCPG